MTGMMNPKVERTLGDAERTGRKPCPFCGRWVKWRLASTIPVRHHRPGYAFTQDGVPVKRWCQAGQP